MEGKTVGLLACMAACVLLIPPVSAQSVAVVGTPETVGRSALVSINMVDVPLSDALSAIARQAGLTPFYGAVVSKSRARVTLRVTDVSVQDAFVRVLAGTGLRAAMVGSRVLFEPADAVSAPVAQGNISGKVIDAKTRQGLRGATITLVGTNKGKTSGDDGSFRISDVVPGSYTVQVRLLGYVKTTKTMAVSEGQTAFVEFVLEPSVNALDQVVVTGTVVSTELRAVPNAITVITAKELEQRGITKLDQLFRGTVPGLFAQNPASNNDVDQVTMYSRGVTSLNDQDSKSVRTPAMSVIAPTGYTGFTNPIKTYVDGVEMADPSYLSQIDPKSIERIEILSGPQASTIYGSSAINGVMQVFTKRGSSPKPQLSLSAMSGLVQNNFSNALNSQHESSAQVNGTEGRMSYNAGGSWSYVGRWSPAKQTARLGWFGGAKLVFPTTVGEVTADLSMRRGITRNRSAGYSFQGTTARAASGLYDPMFLNGVTTNSTAELVGTTQGVTLTYTPTSWWSHDVGMGQDVSDKETRYTAQVYRSPTDTALYLATVHSARRSIRYSNTLQIPLHELAKATVTSGADAWQTVVSSLTARPQSLTGTLSGTTTVTRQPGHNTGAFAQAQVGIADQLFLTYGLRAEWNPNFGADALPNYSSRYGASYTRDLGKLTAKARASYGRSTRPPEVGMAAGKSLSRGFPLASLLLPAYGDYTFFLENRELRPEYQGGWESGMEFYLGRRGSLVITRYLQTVKDVIVSPAVDSVRSMTLNPTFKSSLDADGYGYFYQLQYLNLGSVRNQGWELQGSVNTGPISSRATYSWTKSRTLSVNQKYKNFFNPQTFPQYQAGATFSYLPEHTWAFGMTYVNKRSTIGLNVSGVGQATIASDEFYNNNLSTGIRLAYNRARMGTTPEWRTRPGYPLTDATASHRFSSQVEGVVQVRNLTNNYANDGSGLTATIGRQTSAGLKIRL